VQASGLIRTEGAGGDSVVQSRFAAFQDVGGETAGEVKFASLSTRAVADAPIACVYSVAAN
jgi:hypothetical protein